jgi:ABC-type transport system involved in multi-copper enzyme maturation permease subunit
MPISEWWVIAALFAAVPLGLLYRRVAGRLGVSVFGPLYGFELVRLARRGTHLRLRVALVGLLLLGLLATYLTTFPDTDLASLLFGGSESADDGRLQAFGETFLVAFLIVMQAAVLLITPVYAGGAIAEEKERGRLDFLLTSRLSRWEVVMGKFAARLTYVLAVLFTGLPVLLFTLLFGAVSPDRVLAGFTVAAVTAVSVGALAVVLSVYRHTLRDVLLWCYGLLAVTAVVATFCLCGIGAGSGWAVSPVSVVWRLISIWRDMPFMVDQTWPIVRTYSVVQLAAAGVFLALALWRVRTKLRDEPATTEPPPWVQHVFPPHPDEAEPSPPPPPPAEEPPLPDWYQVPKREVFTGDEPMLIRGRGFVVDKLTDDTDPFVWKERYFSGRLPLVESRWVSWSVGCGFAAFMFLVLGLLFVAFVTDLSRGRWATEAFSVAARVFLVAGLLTVTLVGVRAAVSVGEERAKQTLVSLLTLPVPRRDILRAKGLAAIVRSKWVLIGIGVALAVGLVTFGLHVAGVLAAVSLVCGYTAFLAAVGLWLSVRCATSLRAVLFLFLVVFGVTVGPLLLGPVLDSVTTGTGDAAEVVRHLSPPYAAWSATEQMGNGRDVLTHEREGLLRPVVVFVVGLTYLVAGWVLWERTLRRFEQEGKDDALRGQE